ncbi:MAG: FitA-like ribbon-helix-helix domain-containing protein [Acidimicrobiales bacterium]
MAKNIQVKNVPDDVHEVYRRRAAQAGKSLQEYLLGELVRAAQRPTVEETLARIATYSGGRAPFAETAAAIREERDARSGIPMAHY